MQTETPETRTRRRWHFNRWVVVGVAALLAHGAWTAYAFRSALTQAKALEWEGEYTDPVEAIRADWKAAFKKATWLDGVLHVRIGTGEALEQHRSIVQRLNPKGLRIYDGHALRDLSSLKGLTRLEALVVENDDLLEPAMRAASTFRRNGLSVEIWATGSNRKRFDKASKSGAAAIISYDYKNGIPNMLIRCEPDIHDKLVAAGLPDLDAKPRS